MEEMDGSTPQESSETKDLISEDRAARFESDNSSSSSSISDDDELWNLVRQYKRIKERQRELKANNPDLPSNSSIHSEISDKSLLEQQLVALGELDTQASDIADNIAIQGSSNNPEDQRLTAVAIGIEPNPPRGARPSVAAALATIKVPKTSDHATPEILCNSIHQLTQDLNCKMKALPSPEGTRPEVMDTSS